MENKEVNGDLIHKVFGQIIQDGRIKKGLTQEQLAEAMEVSPKYVSKFETGVRGLAQPKLVKCMELLEISPNTFYKPFLHNSKLQKELEISQELSNFTEEQLDIILNLMSQIKKIK